MFLNKLTRRINKKNECFSKERRRKKPKLSSIKWFLSCCPDLHTVKNLFGLSFLLPKVKWTCSANLQGGLYQVLFKGLWPTTVLAVKKKNSDESKALMVHYINRTKPDLDLYLRNIKHTTNQDTQSFLPDPALIVSHRVRTRRQSELPHPRIVSPHIRTREKQKHIKRK